jgi:hypothetical protein
VNKKMRFEVTALATGETRVFESPVPAHGPGEWPIGRPGTGAPIEIDEPALDRVQLRIFAAGNHLLLLGEVADASLLPALHLEYSRDGTPSWRDPLADWRIPGVPGPLHDGHLELRFDGRPMRIGGHKLVCRWA